jgi:hypothetical protein
MTLRSLAELAVVAALALLIFVPLFLSTSGVQPKFIPAPASTPPPIVRIQGMSHLANTKVHITDSIAGENGHYRGKWGLHGEVVIGTDLSRAQYLSADSAKGEAVLLLPTPQVIATKVNHDRSEELYLRQQTVVPLSSPKVFRDEVWMQADQKIRRLGQDPSYVQQAKGDCQRVLEPLYQQLGWRLRIEWTD